MLWLNHIIIFPPTSNDDIIIILPSLSTDIVPSLHHLSSWIGTPFFLSSFSPENPSCLQWHPCNTPAASQLLHLLFPLPSVILLTGPRTFCKDWLNTIFDVFQIAKNYYYSVIMRCTRRQWNSCNQLLLRWHAKRGRKGVCRELCNDRCVRIWAQRKRYCRKLKDSLCSTLSFCTHCGTISSHVTMQLGDCCCSAKDSYSVKGLSGIMEFIAGNPLRLLSAIKTVVSVKLITLMAWRAPSSDGALPLHWV